MSAANVDRLMQELNIEQLVQIQTSLRQETENKREELRQMVGRRYRDVLEASNTVKRVTEIAGHLVNMMAEIRQYAAQKSVHSTVGEGSNLAVSREANRRLLLLHTLLPMTFTSSDLLSQAFSLCIAENLQRTLASSLHHFAKPLIDQKSEEQNQRLNGPAPVQVIVQLLSDQLLQCRIELLDALQAALGGESDWRKMAGLLVAYALLKPKTEPTAQCQLYLQARMDMVVSSLGEPDSTLLGIIRQLKDTVQCVEQTFGTGQALQSAVQCVTQRGWCPIPIQKLLEDQTLASSRLMEVEIAKVNGLYSMEKMAMPGRQEVQTACTDWVVKMCSAASERVQAMCTYFERVDQAVEFAVAVSHVFKSDWPSAFADSNSLIYRQLFGDALLKRFHHLIDQELRQMEQLLYDRLPHTNCQPQPLFHKRGTTAVKFDAQLASGVSAELQELVQTFNTQLHQLQQNVHKYTSVGQEEQVGTLQDMLAEQVLSLVDRLTSQVSNSQSKALTPLQSGSATTEVEDLPTSSTTLNAPNVREQRAHWLSMFRLLLAMVQHEPSVLCQCMNHNLDRIVKCNRTLHTATEQALCNFMDCIIDDCLRISNLNSKMIETCSSWHAWLDILMEPEQVQLSETVQVKVPTQVSAHIFLFLADICSELNQNSLGHLFTRNVSLHVSRRIGSLLSQLMIQCADCCAKIPLICTQLLFDCKALFQMYPDSQFLEAMKQLEAKLDPIELSVLQEPLARNAKLFSQRTAMLFGQLQAEPITAFNKENQLLPSYSALVDLMPKVQDVSRLTQIPRLSKLKEESQQSLEEGAKSLIQQQQRKLLGDAADGGGHLPGKGAAGTSSFSSLYDKISTGWFKS